MQEWYVHQNGNTTGPFTTDVLKESIKAGKVTTDATFCVTGTTTFRTLAEFCAAQFSPHVPVRGTPRSGPMPHNGYRPFAPSVALTAFPGFQFTPWRDGLARACAATKRA